ncbi:MAG: chromosome segregation protein SMC [Proteobacteria bacterium]|nr:chromosome segregation protein SMC [Pseudomonadota bacterium]
MVTFTKLRLSGFKSFVDATELHIEPGLTGIVGPNGCGKSNLVEALKWVMGETSAKQMRGGDMDEVIFGGTRDRPARNIAEVSLQLDNSQRRATSQFNEADELEVARRIEREKGSNYRVNGRDVRAKDVQLLFADIATGARSTAIVSQGRIGQIIQGKPAQRRHLLEEAAGITGLHTRRHEAELRLKAAETNLARLNDVITALEAQLEGLKKQARQAARYRTISDSIRTAEALVLTIRREEAITLLAKAREGLEHTENQVNELTGIAAHAATVQAEAASAMPALRRTEAEAAARLQHLVITRDKLDEELARIARAREAAEMRIAHIKEDLNREAARLADADAALTRISDEQQEINEAIAAQEEERETTRVALVNAAKAVEVVEEELTLLQKRLSEADVARAAARQQLNEGEMRRQRAERRLADVMQLLEAAQAQALPQEQIDAEEARYSEAENAAAEARAAWEEAERQRSETQAAYEAARNALHARNAEHSKLTAEASALEDLLAEPQTGGDWSPIIDSVAVESGFEAALGAALGDDLSAAGDDVSPKRWMELPAFTENHPLPDGVRSLADVVKAGGRLARRLSQVGIVDDADTGTLLQDQLKPGQRLVTAAGDLFRWDGYVAVAGAPSAAATRLKQRNRLNELQAAIEGSSAVLAEAEAAAEQAKDAIGTAQSTEQSTRQAVRSAEDVRNKARDSVGELRQKAAAVQNRINALDENRAQLTAEQEEAAAHVAGAQERLNELGDGAELRAEAEGKASGLGQLRQQLMEVRAEYDSLHRQAEERARRLQVLASEADSWTQRKNQGIEQDQVLRERLVSEEEELAVLAARPEEIAEQRNALMDQLQIAEAQRREAADALQVGESNLGTADRTLKDAEHALSAAREERVRREGAVLQGEQTLEVVDATIREKIQCEPEEVRNHTKLDEGEEAPTLEQGEKRLQRLLSERENLGAINLRAEQESEELTAQIQGLVTERDDLVQAIARLREGIATLNKEGRDRLTKAFKEVDGHFRNLFTKLFGGGRAHLELTEAEDPLEAGLEIMASPPGKRLGNLGLMSGGEQTLTAIALLFAVFMTNPAPICVLDEADAPLDDANVDRFCTLLSEIIKITETRVLVVTHHRMTMARMDRLFGVTMAERGVSRLVSVDLKAAADMVDTPVAA